MKRAFYVYYADTFPNAREPLAEFGIGDFTVEIRP